MKKNNDCLFIPESHIYSSYYIGLTFYGYLPYYLTTNGDKTILETKLDVLLSKYDNIYMYISNPERYKLVDDFIYNFFDKKTRSRIFVIDRLEPWADAIPGITVEGFDFSEIKSEDDQKTYLISLSNKATCRFFNSIEIGEDYVRKTAKTSNAIRLQRIENMFYNIYGGIVPLAKKTHYDEQANTILLEKVNGMTAQEWNDNNPGQTNNLISKVKLALKKFNDRKILIRDTKDDIKSSFYDELIYKINTRVSPCKMMIDRFFNKTGVRSIDGMKITSSHEKLMNALNEWYSNVANKFEAKLCHGDPNTDNTMVDDNGEIVFIDPRGYFGNLNTLGLGLPEYDIAKFCYGLNGYSRFNKAPYITFDIDFKTKDLRIKYPIGDTKSITQINLDDMDIDINTKIIIGIIWMKLTSYIINDPMKSVAAYLYGNAICTKYLKEFGLNL